MFLQIIFYLFQNSYFLISWQYFNENLPLCWANWDRRSVESSAWGSALCRLLRRVSGLEPGLKACFMLFSWASAATASGSRSRPHRPIARCSIFHFCLPLFWGRTFAVPLRECSVSAVCIAQKHIQKIPRYISRIAFAFALCATFRSGEREKWDTRYK